MTPGAWAQQTTASDVTPSTLQPELQSLNGAVVFSGQAGTTAPAGSESIGITLSGVDVADGLPELSTETAVFRTRLTRGRIPVSELFEATADLEAAYADKGFVLSRVVLPQQSLREGGRLKVVVVNGFIEKVDTSGVPENTRARIDRLTQPLIGKPGLTRRELERQLLLAGDVPGTSLKSALAAGDKPGAAVIALEPDYQRVTGFIGFGNGSGSDLGSISFNSGIEFNSPFRFGETIYLRASGAPTDFLTGDPQSRILAGGAVVPLGYSGLVLNAEFTASDTTPDNPLVPTRANFDRQSIRLIYPFVRSRQMNVSGQVSLDHQEENQEFLSPAGNTPLFEDEITVLRLGGDATFFHQDNGVSSGNLILSRGIDALGARTAADALASGTPLSRQGADAEFTKLAGSISHRRPLSDSLALSVTGRFQHSFGDPLVTSEQFSIVGGSELSTFDTGQLKGDSGYVVRAELSTQTSAKIGETPLLISPYGFLGFGAVKLEQPTASEFSETKAISYGIGVDLFAQTNSNFRSSSVRIEVGKGERNNGLGDDERFSISGNFRF